ncbi:MAG: E3 binding domain-containing protein, partial [Hydrogenophaga sp.]|nr:E3 binding domain-containing protein [Hydrogenophaga sp.]
MATEIKLPHLGESIDSAVLGAWYKQVGDSVKRGEELADLETDKATLSLETPKNGVVLALLADPGDTVHIGQLLAVIGQAGETWTARQESEPTATPEPVAIAAVEEETVQPPAPNRKVKVTPVARRKAKELGVNLDAVQPASGNKITGEDVERYAAGKDSSGNKQTSHRIELSNTKRLVGQRMLESARNAPQFSVTMDAD